jgi:hypothetical protein
MSISLPCLRVLAPKRWKWSVRPPGSRPITPPSPTERRSHHT